MIIWISQCEKVTLALLGAFSLRLFFSFKGSGAWDCSSDNIRPIGRVLCRNKVSLIGQYFFHNSSTISYLWLSRVEEPGGLQSMGSLRVRHD